MRKRLLSIWLLACMLVTLFPSVARAEDMASASIKHVQTKYNGMGAPAQARWGVKGSGGEAPSIWFAGTFQEALNYANSNTGTYIQLLTDINSSNHSIWPITFANGISTELDLNGNDIDRGLTEPTPDGEVIFVYGNTTIKDSSTSDVSNQGRITGGNSSSDTGGGIYVKSAFTLLGGNVTGNKSINGGGVYVYSYCNIYMYGGSITNNEAVNAGGGIYSLSGSATLLGGSITGNKCPGGAVNVKGNLSVGGTTVIQNNTLPSSTVKKNLVLATGKHISVSGLTPLSGGASIGVSTETAPTTSSAINVTGINSSNVSSYFTSDDSAYVVKNAPQNTAVLAVAPPSIGTLTIGDTFTAGTNLTSDSLNSYKPSIQENGYTITAQGWQSTTGNSAWTTFIAGAALPLDTSSTYKIRYYATYSGTTIYSNEVALNVVGKATTLSLTATPNNEQAEGGSVTLSVTLTGFFAGPGVNGHGILIKNGATTIKTVFLNGSGVATTTWTPSAGNYTLTANYSATPYNAASVSNTVNYTVSIDPNVTAVAAAKTALVDGAVDVAFNASQTDKTAAVQAYVNNLLTGGSTGVLATVSYNSVSGKYDVALQKGGISDSKALTMTVNIGIDPNIAVVAAARTAAQNANYAHMNQSTGPDENAIKANLLSIATAAVNHNGVVVTLNKVMYIEPVAGTASNPNGTPGSYAFTITVTKGAQSQTTDQKTISILAKTFTTGTGGNGSTGGSGGGSTPTVPERSESTDRTTTPVAKTTLPATGSVENKATVDNQGKATIRLTDKNIADAISDAKAEAAKKGASAGEITAMIRVNTNGAAVDTMTVNLPKLTQEQVISNQVAVVQLVIDRPDLMIGIDLAAIESINRQAKADVSLNATRRDSAKLSEEAQAVIGNRPAFDFNISYGNGGLVSNFDKGRVRVEIPYILGKNEVQDNVHAVYVDDLGKVSFIPESEYDAKRGTVVFYTSHFSIYGVGYKNNLNFTDINDHWAKEDILFIANKGLISGVTPTTFNPNGAVTREMFVTALGRLVNADISPFKQSSFKDVKANDEAMGYIEWGVKNNILSGVGGGKFDPKGLVTREQMAVIMDRYAAAVGLKLQAVYQPTVFTDHRQIGLWAVSSVKRIQMAGIIKGKSNNVFDPKGTANRGEVSSVLRHFIERSVAFDTEKTGQ